MTLMDQCHSDTSIVSVPSVSASFIQLVVILILNKIYWIVAVVLVHMELPRTDTEFGDNITAKICVFQFVNFYAAMFYVAFVKSRRDAWPGSYSTIAGNRVDQCDPCGCLIELCIQVRAFTISESSNISESSKGLHPICPNVHFNLFRSYALHMTMYMI